MADRRALEECAAALGVSLSPVHPGSSDRDLASYFATRTSVESAERIATALRQCPGVEAARVKPAGEPPGGA